MGKDVWLFMFPILMFDVWLGVFLGFASKMGLWINVSQGEASK
jgi:hypothetical protein